jgi:hypothetical protein
VGTGAFARPAKRSEASRHHRNSRKSAVSPARLSVTLTRLVFSSAQTLVIQTLVILSGTCWFGEAESACGVERSLCAALGLIRSQGILPVRLRSGKPREAQSGRVRLRGCGNLFGLFRLVLYVYDGREAALI